MNREAIDLSKIKVGDEVLLRATVIDATPTCFGQIQVRLERGAMGLTGTRINVEHIVSHTPRALEVGDRVKMRGWAATLRLLCIHGPWAWMADDDDTTIQGPLAHLERA